MVRHGIRVTTRGQNMSDVANWVPPVARLDPPSASKQNLTKHSSHWIIGPKFSASELDDPQVVES